MMLARYIESLVADYDDQETQDAVEWAIFSNWLKLTYDDRKKDHQTICGLLPEILEAYRRMVRQTESVQAELTLL